MINLIKKEVIVSKNYGLVSLAYGFMFPFIIYNISDQLLAQTIFISMVLLTSAVGYDAMLQADTKNNSSILICSLPINRSHAIISKYLSIGLYPLIISIIIFLFVSISKAIQTTNFLNTTGNLISVYLLILSISLTLIYFAINMPIYYYSMGVGKIISKVSYIFAILMPGIISKYSQQLSTSPTLGYIFGLNLKLYSLITLGISLIFYLASLQFSIKIYNKKEF